MKETSVSPPSLPCHIQVQLAFGVNAVSRAHQDCLVHQDPEVNLDHRVSRASPEVSEGADRREPQGSRASLGGPGPRVYQDPLDPQVPREPEGSMGCLERRDAQDLRVPTASRASLVLMVGRVQLVSRATLDLQDVRVSQVLLGSDFQVGFLCTFFALQYWMPFFVQKRKNQPFFGCLKECLLCADGTNCTR